MATQGIENRLLGYTSSPAEQRYIVSGPVNPKPETMPRLTYAAFFDDDGYVGILPWGRRYAYGKVWIKSAWGTGNASRVNTENDLLKVEGRVYRGDEITPERLEEVNRTYQLNLRRDPNSSVFRLPQEV